MLSLELSSVIYEEVCGSVLGRLSVGLGVSVKELRGLLDVDRKVSDVDMKVSDVDRKVSDVDMKVSDVDMKVSDVDMKVKKEEVKRLDLKGVIPWCGEVLVGHCSALRLNNGLHTQCTRLKSESSKYCCSCVKLIEKNEGLAPYGNVEDRLRCGILDYVDPKGKATIPYANVMKKLNINKEEAMREASRLNWIIPECHFEEKKGKRGRPKKETSADDTDSEDGEKKKRGRPKNTKEIKNNDAGEDLIASLLEQENKEIEEICEEKIEEEEEETKVLKFEYDGKCYLKSEDDVLYDIESHDAVGVWNEKEKKIDEFDEDEDE